MIALIFLSVTLLTLHSREGESGVLHRVQDFSREAVAPLSSAVTGVFVPLRHGWEYIISIGRLQKENKELREELADIKEKLIKLRVAEEENKQLRALLQLKEELPDKTLTARVINRIFSGGQAAIVLNKGTSDGIFKGMPVLVKEGLVGQVISASPNASLVQLLIDPKSGVGVQILRTGENGILEGQIN
ncbi:MAG: rod shape-determining protein MreC, partial [Candidatus Subteraquimicrobiales bacterium]|nr:rod shape-determining protein MreC [Candidatus Subteraquimicrobiales bacterium]